MFIETEPFSIVENVFKAIGSDWMLITAGNLKSYNTMTASWGGLGVLWNMNVSFIFVRPSRHTYGFIEKNDFYTLSFFGGLYRKQLQICGEKSGRDTDKALETGLTPAETGKGNVFFRQASLVIECRKVYFQDIDPGSFLDPGIGQNYPENNYHRMYAGEITSVLKNSEPYKK